VATTEDRWNQEYSRNGSRVSQVVKVKTQVLDKSCESPKAEMKTRDLREQRREGFSIGKAKAYHSGFMMEERRIAAGSGSGEK